MWNSVDASFILAGAAYKRGCSSVDAGSPYSTRVQSLRDCLAYGQLIEATVCFRLHISQGN